jgi:L,D-transpeptidase YcbB
MKLSSFVLSCFLIICTATIFLDCGSWNYKKESADKIDFIAGMIHKEVSDPDVNQILNPEIITELYVSHADLFSEVWQRQESLEDMLFAIRNANLDGLRPEDYHLSAIENLIMRIDQSKAFVTNDETKLELLLVDSFLLLSSHLAGGKTNAEKTDPQWNASRRIVRLDLNRFIDSTFRHNCIREGLQALTPRHREYINLKAALSAYRKIELNGGWETFSTSLPKLELGMRHPDIALLRRRLSITQSYIPYDTTDEDLFDHSLQTHVILFQLRNGLASDGVIGKATIEAMNISVQDRIASIEANLERWRWIGDDLGDCYIKVNIANFELQVIDHDSIVFNTAAIVGRSFRETPVFSSSMTYLVLNPDWTVPPTILKNDIIPSVKENPAYLSERNLKILNSDGVEIDPSSIDWNSAAVNGFPYRIHQAPGKDNALGSVKFIFPNRYNVYIHDTPNRSLFGRTDRSLSSGCIRVNDPFELTAWLLKDNPYWTPRQIQHSLDQGKERAVVLPNPIQVHILYLTAWASDDGVVYFRKDIYQRDLQLLAALKQNPPGSQL